MGWDSVRFCHNSGTSRAKPTRCHVYVCQFCDPEQAIVRRTEWSSADCGLSSVRRWASCCGFTFCIFRDERHSRRELCVCCAAGAGGHWVVFCREASETCVDAWWGVDIDAEMRSSVPFVTYEVYVCLVLKIKLGVQYHLEALSYRSKMA